jgi:hypothetical protein
MIGLLLVYQVIDTWQRCKRWCLSPVRWSAQKAAAQPALRLRSVVAIALLAFQTGFGATLVVTHRAHLHLEASNYLIAMQTLCRTAAEQLL